MKKTKFTIIKTHPFLPDEPFAVVTLPHGRTLDDLRSHLVEGLIAKRATKAEIKILPLEHVTEAEFLFG
jgi:hypothetical protein